MLDKNVELSIIAPMYNEEEVISIFFSKLNEILTKEKISFEIICINDGSTDSTLNKLRDHSSKDHRIKVVNLSRNFGKETALSAGFDYCSGLAAIPMDCDLQDPPELISEMLKSWKDGFDVVLAKRVDRSSDSLIKRNTSSLFYKLISKLSEIDIPENVGDFRLLDRKVIDVLKTYPERTRFMKGIFASLGFNSSTIEFIRPERAAGITKWNYFSLYKLAIEGIISFTSFPLKIWSYIGFTVSIASFIYGLFLLIKTMTFGVDVPGYASTLIVFLFMSGLILMSIGMLGEYVARIFIEVKQRPNYIVSETIGLE